MRSLLAGLMELFGSFSFVSYCTGYRKWSRVTLEFWFLYCFFYLGYQINRFVNLQVNSSIVDTIYLAGALICAVEMKPTNRK
eukprot:UN03548